VFCIATVLRAGRSGVRIAVRSRDFYFSLLQTFQTITGAPSDSCSVGTGVLSRV